MLSSATLVTISIKTSLIESFPVLEKASMHLAMFVFSILIILLFNKGKLKGYGFNWSVDFPVIKIILISLLFGFVFSIIEIYIIPATTENPTSNFSFIEDVIYIWLLASVAEEVLARGLIQGYLSPLKHIRVKLLKYDISLPILVGALFFGAMHLMLLSIGIDIYKVLNIVIFGILLGLIAGYQKEKTNSLIPAIIVHMCFNVGGSILSVF